MQVLQSYFSVVDQLIADIGAKYPGLQDTERLKKVIALEGLDYSGFYGNYLSHAFKRIKEILDEKVDLSKVSKDGNIYRYFNYIRVVGKFLDTYPASYLVVSNFIDASIHLVTTDTPVLEYMVDRSQHTAEDDWLIKALSDRARFWVDPIVLQTKRELPIKHRGMFVNAQNGNTFGYVATYDNLTNTMNIDWDSKIDELSHTVFLSTAQAMIRAIDYYGLTKDDGERVHVGFKDNVFLHITYP